MGCVSDLEELGPHGQVLGWAAAENRKVKAFTFLPGRVTGS